MPLGKADLNDEDAFDVAAYINSKPRPAMADLAKDYPDLTKKPVDTGYGPYADNFPLEQHQFGPFQPIEDYYKHLARK
jgi:thiosulfate dehydrogenase